MHLGAWTTTHRLHGQPVGHGMSALHRLPGRALALLLVGRVVRVEPDGCGVDEQLGTLQGHQACGLRIPLVPADEHAQPSHTGVYRVEAQVAGGEVELLVVAGVVGNVHFPVGAGYVAVLVEYDSRVVVESQSSPLKQRGDNDHAQPSGQCTEEVGGGSRYGLCLVEHADVFRLTEVQPVVQLLQHHQFGALSGQLCYLVGQPAAVVVAVGSVMLLDNAYFHRLTH